MQQWQQWQWSRYLCPSINLNLKNGTSTVPQGNMSSFSAIHGQQTHDKTLCHDDMFYIYTWKQASQSNRATNFNGSYNYLHLHLKQMSRVSKALEQRPPRIYIYVDLHWIIYIELDLSIVLKVKVCNDGILIRRLLPAIHTTLHTIWPTHDMILFFSLQEKRSFINRSVNAYLYIYLSTMYCWNEL